jgi:hypothetical protein
MKILLNRLFYMACSYALYALLFAAYRVFFLCAHANADAWSYKTDIMRAFGMGLRFDTKVITILLLPILLLAIADAATHKWHAIRHAAYTAVNGALFGIAAAMLAADFYYYSFFQSHFDIMAMGIFDDDTTEVLRQLWQNYPVIRFVVGIGILTLVSIKVFAWLIKIDIVQKARAWSARMPALSAVMAHRAGRIATCAGIIIAFAVVFFFGLRGKFGTFPLQMDDASISPNPFVNCLTLNGIYTMQQALKHNNNIGGDAQQYLAANGLTLRQLVADFLQCDISMVDESAPLTLINTTTPYNQFLEENPPHVVVIMMESMGSIYWARHSEHLNMLGTLADVLPACHVLQNFMPARNGTLCSLEEFIAQTPWCGVAQSAHYNKTFSTATAMPFARNGYQTSFVSGAKLNWRNIVNYLPHQGFHMMEGKNDILEHNPHAIESGWGVFDEYMFDRIFEKLTVAEQRGATRSNADSVAPQYIFGMSITNHGPYEIPAHYHLLPLRIDDTLRSMLRSTVDIENVTVGNLQTYQYACDALGRFIQKVMASPLAQRTIIIASGDHNLRQSFNFDDMQLYWTYSVPMVAYIPKQYLHGRTLDTRQWACHGDIFPTLYGMALSQAEYVKLGRDMLLDTAATAYAMNAGHRVLTAHGAADVAAGQYLCWDAGKFLKPCPHLAQDSAMQRAVRSAIARQHLKMYLELENVGK